MVTYKLMQDAKMKLIKKCVEHVNCVRVPVYGDSMEPTILEGSVITIKQKENYLPGDVVLFYDSQYRLVVHRIVSVSDDLVCLKGDNGDLYDYIPPNQIFGGMVAESVESQNLAFEEKIENIILRLTLINGVLPHHIEITEAIK